MTSLRNALAEADRTLEEERIGARDSKTRAKILRAILQRKGFQA